MERLVEYGIIGAKGEKRGRIYHLAVSVYRIFGEKAGYIRVRGFVPIQQEQMVIQYVKGHGKIKRGETAELCRITVFQANRLLTKLWRKGKLLRKGQGKGTYYVLPE